jgi:O-antigen ligase
MPFNKSLLGILIASCFFYCQPFFRNQKTFYRLLVICITIILLLQSRAGVLCFLVGVIILCYLNGRFSHLKVSLRVLIIVLGLLIAGTVAFMVKEDSTSGRLFIWRNSISIIKQNFFTGVGVGKFRVAYNEQQVKWFEQNGFNNKEALLADTVYYAFNEWLQIAVQIGAPLTLLLLMVTLLIFYISIKKLRYRMHKRFEIGCVSAFASLLTGTFISYPFYFLPTFLIFLFLCFYLLQIIVEKQRIKLIIFLLLFFLFIYAGGNFYRQVIARTSWKEASEFKSVGYKKKAKNKMLSAYSVLRQNGDFLYSLGDLYYTLNQNNLAIYYINKSSNYKNDYNLHRKLAQLYFDTKMTEKAEQHFLKAVYMVPNRFVSRELLIDFYIKSGNHKQAQYWAIQTLRFPEKVPSETTKRIKQRLHAYINAGKW